MKKNTNITLICNGSLFGFPVNFGIAKIDKESLIAGSLNTKGKDLDDFIQNEEIGVASLSDKLTVIPKSCTDFSALFAKKPDAYVFLLQFQGIACGITIGNQSKQLLLALNTENLKNGNQFEQFVASVADWAKIDSLCIVARDKSDANGLSFLRKIAGDTTLIPNIPKGYEKFQFIAIGIFDLTKNEFGKNLCTLTKLNQLQIAIGGSFLDQSFGAKLTENEIENESFIIRDLSFGILKTKTSFNCIASGTFIFKLENKNLGFTLSGAVSNASFTLSASSTPDTSIVLNSRLSFSDLGLSIGVSNGSVSFGMLGRLSTPKLSIFAGFVVAPPRISLLTAALTSTTGRITLKDIVTEIADIQWDQADCLDVIAIGDFDLTESSLPKGIRNFPTDNTDENYEKDKNDIEQRIVAEFNKVMKDSVLHIDSENTQLSPLGNNTNQFILTDKGTMRHYRIDSNGKISLNCQIYVCSEENLRIGNYEMPMGFFVCGTLELFNVKARFLFLIDKGKSLIALVQITKIEIHNVFSLSKSNKALPIDPINGGLAGQLIKPSDDGLVMYLNIQKDKGEIIFYLDARVSIFDIFVFDALVLLKNRFVYINIEFVYWGFRIILNLNGKYEGFSNAGFEATAIFDTSNFLDLLSKAQESLKSAAKSVRSGIEEANRKLNEAQRTILDLNTQINNYNNRINQCKRDISNARWYQVPFKIAKGVEIVGLEVAKVGIEVAIAVAYNVLEVAKVALNLGGKAVSSVLESLSNLIESVTQLLWIKSFELGIIANSSSKEIKAKLVLIVLGKEVNLDGVLDLNRLTDNIKDFVSEKLTTKTNSLIDDIKKKKVLGIAANDLSTSMLEYDNPSEIKEKYTVLSDLRDSLDELFLDANNSYSDAFDEENTSSLEYACRITELRLEEEMLHSQYSNAFDSEFVESLEKVINVIQEENTNNLQTSPSSEQDKRMEDLLDVVKNMSEANKLKRATNKESLYSRLERSMQSDNKNKLRTNQSNLDASEANQKYADSLSNLVNFYLGDRTDEISNEFKNMLIVSIDQFRNQGANS